MIALFAYVQRSQKWTEWTFRLISQRQMQLLIALDEVEPIERMKDGVFQLVGYKATKPTRRDEVSACALTFRTMLAVGKQAHGHELDRREEREVIRFRLDPFVGDRKNPLTGPRYSPADLRLAESILAAERLPIAA